MSDSDNRIRPTRQNQKPRHVPSFVPRKGSLTEELAMQLSSAEDWAIIRDNFEYGTIGLRRYAVTHQEEVDGFIEDFSKRSTRLSNDTTDRVVVTVGFTGRKKRWTLCPSSDCIPKADKREKIVGQWKFLHLPPKGDELLVPKCVGEAYSEVVDDLAYFAATLCPQQTYCAKHSSQNGFIDRGWHENSRQSYCHTDFLVFCDNHSKVKAVWKAPMSNTKPENYASVEKVLVKVMTNVLINKRGAQNVERPLALSEVPYYHRNDDYPASFHTGFCSWTHPQRALGAPDCSYIQEGQPSPHQYPMAPNQVTSCGPPSFHNTYLSTPGSVSRSTPSVNVQQQQVVYSGSHSHLGRPHQMGPVFSRVPTAAFSQQYSHSMLGQVKHGHLGFITPEIKLEHGHITAMPEELKVDHGRLPPMGSEFKGDTSHIGLMGVVRVDHGHLGSLNPDVKLEHGHLVSINPDGKVDPHVKFDAVHESLGTDVKAPHHMAEICLKAEPLSMKLEYMNPIGGRSREHMTPSSNDPSTALFGNYSVNGTSLAESGHDASVRSWSTQDTATRHSMSGDGSSRSMSQPPHDTEGHLSAPAAHLLDDGVSQGSYQEISQFPCQDSRAPSEASQMDQPPMKIEWAYEECSGQRFMRVINDSQSSQARQSDFKHQEESFGDLNDHNHPSRYKASDSRCNEITTTTAWPASGDSTGQLIVHSESHDSESLKLSSKRIREEPLIEGDLHNVYSHPDSNRRMARRVDDGVYS